MSNAPRKFETERPEERLRLLREVRGYIQTCHKAHHGTDLEGRRFAMEGLDNLIDAWASVSHL